MSESVPVLFAVLIAVQVPVGIVLYFDAKRLNLRNPEKYWFGVIIPAAGFLVILYYFSERTNLPKEEIEDS